MLLNIGSCISDIYTTCRYYGNVIYIHNIHVHVLFQGGTPLHYYVWVDNRKKEKTDFLVSLLTEGEVDVNSKTEEGNTALHLAVKVSTHSTRLTSKKAKCIEQQSPALVDSAVCVTCTCACVQ